MVGIIVRINVREGEHVEKDDPILVLEAMKMETTITSPVAGRVKTILVSGGESVQSGQVLVEFE
jgi:methylmalonyl-CoA carboxyltransferase small subunit